MRRTAGTKAMPDIDEEKCQPPGLRSLAFDDLKIFSEIARHGSMSAAARSLGANPALASKRLGKVENALGMHLFHRTTRQLRLTEAGERLLSRLDTLLTQVQEAENFARQSGAAVRISAPSFWCRRLFGHGLPRLHGVDIEIACDDRPGGTSEAADADIILTADGRSAEGASAVLGSWPQHFFATATYLLERGIPETLTDLESHRLLLPSKVLLLQGSKQSLSVAFIPALRCNCPDTLHAALGAGCGIALCPPFGLESELQNGVIRRVLPAYRTVSSLVAHGPKRGWSAASRVALAELKRVFSASLERSRMADAFSPHGESEHAA